MHVGFDIHAVLRRVLKNGGEYADLYLERSSPLAIQCEDDRIEKVIAGREYGAGLRLISGKRTAYAYTNDADHVIAARLGRGNEQVGQRQRGQGSVRSCCTEHHLTAVGPS